MDKLESTSTSKVFKRKALLENIQAQIIAFNTLDDDSDDDYSADSVTKSLKKMKLNANWADLGEQKELKMLEFNLGEGFANEANTAEISPVKNTDTLETAPSNSVFSVLLKSARKLQAQETAREELKEMQAQNLPNLMLISLRNKIATVRKKP